MLSETKSRSRSGKYLGIDLRGQNTSVEVDVKPEEKGIFRIGDIVIVKSADKLEDGKISYISNEKKSRVKSDYGFLRKTDERDIDKIRDILFEEKEASRIFSQKVEKYRLEMKLLKTFISFDQKHLIFYFSAETRLDFRDLLKDLVRTFHKLIRLQQIGPRDEAKLISDLGPCGRKLCCQTFLKKLETIPSDLAKLQKLSQISSSKISGSCGKLMCCLAFEAEIYQKLQKDLPKVGEIIETKQGKGKVIGQDIINQKVRVELAGGKTINLTYKNK